MQSLCCAAFGGAAMYMCQALARWCATLVCIDVCVYICLRSKVNAWVLCQTWLHPLCTCAVSSDVKAVSDACGCGYTIKQFRVPSLQPELGVWGGRGGQIHKKKLCSDCAWELRRP